eukprot:5632571-Amphidinium_carterae.2
MAHWYQVEILEVISLWVFFFSSSCSGSPPRILKGVVVYLSLLAPTGGATGSTVAPPAREVGLAPPRRI